MNEINLIEAVNQALDYELAADPEVVVFGEDVGLDGGVFRATVGLLQKYGNNRVIDTPLAENLIAGISIGLAAQGFKPVAEFQFMGFIYAGLDQIISHASRMRNRTRGRISCSLVMRTPYGGGIHAPEHHSESTEALFAHIPGLRVVIPSSPAMAYGLLLASIRDPDPVIFLEPTKIYRLIKQQVTNDGTALPLDVCFIQREGTDVTLVAWGAMMHETIKAADQLAQQGIQAEIIDVATIKPLDMDTIINSVTKTGRCVIVHEAARTCGVGAEIAANLAEFCLTALLAPVKRVTGYDTIMPLYQLEDKYMPNADNILSAVHEVMEYT